MNEQRKEGKKEGGRERMNERRKEGRKEGRFDLFNFLPLCVGAPPGDHTEHDTEHPICQNAIILQVALN